MGLDLYIHKKQVSDNHSEIMKKITAGKKPPRFETVAKETEVLYLRKANQIHNYFVENFGNGEDNCQEIPIRIDDIKKLRDICKEILEESEIKDAYLRNGGGIENREPDEEVELVKLGEKGSGFEKIGRKAINDLKVGDVFIEILDEKKEPEIISESNKWGKFVKYKKAAVDEANGKMEIVLEYDFLVKGKKITNSDKARELLPTTSGFFFGSTEYDEWYLEDLKSYIEQADRIIKEHEEDLKNGVEESSISYYYRASW